MTGSSKKVGIVARLTGARTQPSLFHYVKETPDPSGFDGADWSFLRHPVRSFIEAWRAPRTKPSLFHYTEEDAKTPLSFREILNDLFTGYRNPLFIPSVFSDPAGLELERAQGRTRKVEAGFVSIVAHILVICLLIFIVLQKADEAAPKNDDVVFVNNPVVSPFEGDGRDGGGGGGGGRINPCRRRPAECPKRRGCR